MIVTIIISILLVGLAISIRSIVVGSREESFALTHGDRQSVFDVKILEQLLSTAEDKYLEENLPRQEFHRIRRKRASLALRYLRLFSQHVRQPLIASESAGSLDTREMQNVTMITRSVRMKIQTAQVYLVVQWIFPAANLSRWVGGAKLCRRLDQAVRVVANQR